MLGLKFRLLVSVCFSALLVSCGEDNASTARSSSNSSSDSSITKEKVVEVVSPLAGTSESVNENEDSMIKSSEQSVDSSNLMNMIDGLDRSSYQVDGIKTGSDGSYYTIEDNAEDKIGWVLWRFQDFAESQSYKVKMEIQKSAIKDLSSQFQIRFLVDNVYASTYVYYFSTESGLVAPQQDADEDSFSVKDNDGSWSVEFLIKSPSEKSTMEFIVYPALGVPTGEVKIKSVKIEKS